MGSPRKPRRSPLRPLESLEAREVPAAGLLADLNTLGSDAFTADAYQQAAVTAGGSAYFFATDGTHPIGLFKSDGTAAGTTLVKELTTTAVANHPMEAYLSNMPPSRLVAAGNKVYFAWNDGTSGTEVWVSDGTAAGTRLAADVAPGSGHGFPQLIGQAGGKLVFAANNTGDPSTIGIMTGLYATDGTAAGTTLLVSFASGSYPGGYAEIGGKVYFSWTTFGPTSTGQPVSAVWATDGTAAGTAAVASVPTGVWTTTPEQIGATGPLGGVTGKAIFFAATDATGNELWISDAAGVRRLADINPRVTDAAFNSGLGSNPRQFVTVGSSVYFVADDGTHGDQLWVSDGTTAGTKMVKDLGQAGGTAPLPYMGNGAKIEGLTAANGKVYFSADDATGPQLYVSDGTAAGTVRLTSVTHTPPPMPGMFGTPEGPAFLTAVGGRVFFTIGDQTNGRQVWSTDGTVAGTRMTRAFATTPALLTAVGGKMLFAADDGTNGRQLWASDGTAAGTALLKRLNPATEGSNPSGFLAVGNRAYFVTDTGVYVTDGTAAPTLLRRFGGVYDGPTAMGVVVTDAPTQLTASGGSVYFVVRAGWYGRQLWKTDGTAAGTTLVKGLANAVGGGPFLGVAGGIDDLTDVGGTLYFTVDVAGGGQSLWRSDGTAAGTRQVKQINPASTDDSRYGYPSPPTSGGTTPAQLTAAGGRLFFVADDGQHGAEVWVSDGTAAGTTLVKDLNTDTGWISPRTLGSSPADLTYYNGKVYFTATPEGSGSRELWVTDGTAAGTTRVAVLPGGSSGTSPFDLLTPVQRGMAAVGGKLYLTTSDGAWVSDGTAAGTRTLTTPVATPTPDTFGPSATQLTPSGSKVFFVRSDGTHGRQLWVSDGTAAGTKVPLVIGTVKTVYPGTPYAYQTDGEPTILAAAGGRVLFAVNDGTRGRELWVSDGTAAGTRLVRELNPGPGDGLPNYPDFPFGSPESAVVVGDKLLLAGTDAARGSEPWVVSTSDFLPTVPPPPPPPPPPGPVTPPGPVAVARLVRTLAPSATEGRAFTADLAVVNLPAGPAYKVWVFWGDGRTAQATLTPTGKAAGEVTLSALHTYADPGTYPVMIRVTADAKTVLSIDTRVTVADSKWYAGRVADRVTAGQLYVGVVATIQDLNPTGGKTTDYTATIDWGDGRTGTGTIRKTAAGRYEVIGAGTFAAAGRQTVTVTIRSSATGTTATAASVFVIDAARVPPR